MTLPIEVKRALISVSDKTGLVDFARQLTQLDIEIISSGGTSKLLKEHNIPTREISEVTGFPEMMDGRVKTLHPKIHAGILGMRDHHAAVAAEHHIDWIDLVIVNLYPFSKTIQNPHHTFEEAIENIDIGGPTLIRAAAKNMGWVGVVVDINDYNLILSELNSDRKLSFSTRRKLAQKAFAHTASYDAVIHQHLEEDPFPAELNIASVKQADLRYGENPHQKASAYRFENGESGILSAKQHQGKQLSYNNIADSDAAWNCLLEFSKPACVIVKHANPCGVAYSETIEKAFESAYLSDSKSAFGGVVVLNRPCDEALAQKIAPIFFEVLIAPDYSEAALKILSQKPNLRVLTLSQQSPTHKPEMKFITGGFLLQDKDHSKISLSDLKTVTTQAPSSKELETLLFAWQVIKYIKSNAILIAKAHTTLGIGAGQVSRIDSVELALKKAGNNLQNAVLASDAFFPFRDSIDAIAQSGIKAIIQPGGSLKDNEVIDACNEHGIAMVFTGIRCFKH